MKYFTILSQINDYFTELPALFRKNLIFAPVNSKNSMNGDSIERLPQERSASDITFFTPKTGNNSEKIWKFRENFLSLHHESFRASAAPWQSEHV